MRRAETGGLMQRALVERAQSGDHEAFSVLVRTSYPRLLSVAILVLRDRDRAQDAVQDALVLAWRHIRALRDADAWDAWLYRLTLRACNHAARTSRRRDVVELHVEPDRHPSVETDLAGIMADREVLAAALDDLPYDQRVVMVLHFHLDLPLTEAAAILDIPVGTAKSRLHRGLAAMRTTLGVEPERELGSARERPA
jgi:RNA polymerase sigma-70 factor (ECF subfamily)